MDRIFLPVRGSHRHPTQNDVSRSGDLWPTSQFTGRPSAKLVPVSQIVYGTDFPYRTAADHTKGVNSDAASPGQELWPGLTAH
jgi:hypothetical protein